MHLYHGSNVEVCEPKLFQSDRRLDFGSGFYLTSDRDQASKWARLTTMRRKHGTALVTVYDFDEQLLPGLSVLTFATASPEWLEFVAANRLGKPISEHYDLIVGPVANDTTMPTLRGFFAGLYTEEETLRRLLPQNLKDQYAFRTQNALDSLTFIKAVQL